MIEVFTVLGRNFAIVAVAHVVARLLNLVVLALVARRLGVESVGGFAIASAIGLCFLLACDLGLAARLVRESAARPRDGGREYAEALGAKVALLPILALAIAGLYALRPFEPGTTTLSVLLAAGGVIESFSVLNHAVCRARERFDFEAVGIAVQALAFVAIVAASLHAGYGMIAIGGAAIGAAVAELFVSETFVRRLVRTSISFRHVVATLRAAIPYATIAAALALAQLDVVILSLVATPVEVGRYAAVSRLLRGGTYFVFLAADVAVPAATLRYVSGDRARFWRTSSSAVRLMLAAAAPAGILLAVSARFLIQLVYGPSFEPAYFLLRLGGAFVALKLCTIPLQTMLTVTGRQSSRARSVGCALIVTAISILALGARHGAAGAVVALACGEVAALVIAWIAMRDVREPASQLS